MHTARRTSTAALLDPPRFRRWWERALVVSFLLAISVPGLATLAGVDREIIEGENRQLAPFPAFAFDRATLVGARVRGLLCGEGGRTPRPR